jgi:hypothetical protein
MLYKYAFIFFLGIMHKSPALRPSENFLARTSRNSLLTCRAKNKSFLQRIMIL